ncbi:UDP-glucuronate 4-epimerase [Algoriphagus faecimaris]|uniref:UDP-glucuronate 4-epimerase n=1 Tax=Algoriphagus faecimaris TaxID=686796 RepID=A0A1G6UC21_9BACT|nr:NAD-dependent epimerase/dehydratase family protein [Algoriphagus faecimaris]SDD38799.1 UDP-glucuronate 4-epimerase [Algoriphagus faecimaris]
MKRILVTGAAGFIGFHLCKKLLELGHQVVGVDNLNGYYDPQLKLARLKELGISGVELENEEIKKLETGDFTFLKADITDDKLWALLSKEFQITSVVHLAAQAGVRYSLENPKSYIKNNVEGFLNVLEFCRYQKINHLIYASSSSVYGKDSEQPFSEDQPCNKPISLYATTKRSNELMAFTYHHLFGINSIGLRFFTVYGPWGRPDMAPFLFTKAAFEGTPIKVFNYGKQKRDFTYIDDIVNGIVQVFNQKEKIEGAEICNIGQGKPIELDEFLREIEFQTGKSLKKEFVEAQPGDVELTFADISNVSKKYLFIPSTQLKKGILGFIKWYKEFK